MPEEKAEQTPQESKKKGKKINKMTLEEINKKLEEIKGVQGGMNSRYAKHLLRRKNFLGSK